MTTEEREIAKRNINAIQKYRLILRNIMGYPISLEQAMADWIEQGYHREFLHENYSDEVHLN